MKNIPPHDSFLSIRPLRLVLTRLPVLVGACATLAILGVVLGWVYTMGYLSVFGAYWLIHQYPASYFLQISWPLVALILIWSVFASKTATTDCNEAELKTKQITSRDLFRMVHWCIITYFLTHLVLFLMNISSIPLNKYISLVIDFIFLNLSLWLLFVTVRLKTFRWDYTSAVIVGFAVILIFGVFPWHGGRIIGQMDSNPKKSTLPIVQVKETQINNRNLRLMLHIKDRFYLVQLGKTKNPSVSPYTMDDIIKIKK